ncbi:hypothetical protein [Thalassobacillus sp. C254]|uniref:hypothetical protein n=1 Tax=Thalassobacillus sp. C254 TaxID=1225341 RepID=UPI0006D22E5F|nr:hypothetical protein [Thalassobacillus sp. C254]
MKDTCPYCGSRLDQTFYCDFCVMTIPKEKVQTDHLRENVLVRDFVFREDAEKTTPELQSMTSFELMMLLKLIRKERATAYKLMTHFYRARKTGNLEYQNQEEDQGEDYQYWTKKMFVVENLLRERMVYIPQRLTDTYLENMRDHIKKLERKPMHVKTTRAQNNDQNKKREYN